MDGWIGFDATVFLCQRGGARDTIGLPPSVCPVALCAAYPRECPAALLYLYVVVLGLVECTFVHTVAVVTVT